MLETPPKRDLAFSTDEYRLRIDSLRSAMLLQELDALLLSEPANIAWASGYDALSIEAPCALLITHGEDPRWWGAERDLPGAAASVWMADAALATYAETAARHPFEDLAGKLKGWGLGAARIGVELDSAFFSAGSMGVLIGALSSARYVDATALADWRRVVKSDAEIALMRAAAERADAAQERALAAAIAGKPKAELLSEIAAALAPGGANAVAPAILSGAEIAARGLSSASNALSADETHAVVLAGTARGYCCPTARSFALGAPDTMIEDAATRAADAFDAAIAAAKPGAPAGAVADAFLADLKGGQDAVGWSVGLARPPRWRERSLRLVAGETTELLEGMTLWLRAGPAELGAPLLIDETLLLTASGAEALSTTPRELAVKK